MEIKADNILDIHMLGGFTMAFGGKELPLGRKNTAKFIQLLQHVWLNGEKGVVKEVLINNLYDRDTPSNVNNCFNNLIYQANKQMGRYGLPEGAYIERKNGLYVPGDAVAVRVDALEFEKLAHKALRAEDEEEKYNTYKEAYNIYQGELLPAVSNETWVVAESFRFQKLFEECVCWMGDYLKKKRDYDGMYRVYTKAAKFYPFDDWQVNQIDSLLNKGEYREAYRLYDRTVRMYSDEMGLPPSQKMLECYTLMNQKITYCPDDITEIQAELEGNSENVKTGGGGYYCTYPSFIDAYRLLVRNMERMGNSIFLMLCTLADQDGKFIQNQEKLKQDSEILREAIRSSLRRSDAFTKYNDSQYLILLVQINQEDCQIIFRRIARKLKEMSGIRAELNYSAASLLKLPDDRG